MKQRSLLKTISQDLNNNVVDSAEYFNGIFSLYLHKKLRRLAEAIYLVTNHINESDPLKNLIRIEATRIINLSLKIRGDGLGETNSVLYKEIVTSTAAIISFLEVAAISGMISESNYHLINKELNIIFASLEDRLEDFTNSNDSLSASFFNVEIGKGELERKDNQKDKIIKDKRKDLSLLGTDIKDNNIDIKNSKTFSYENRIKDKNINNQNRPRKILRTVEKLDREKMILDFFKDNKKMGIKDISVLLPGYSEKTIQREILRLVSRGILSKSGRKRWTLYFLS